MYFMEVFTMKLTLPQQANKTSLGWHLSTRHSYPDNHKYGKIWADYNVSDNVAERCPVLFKVQQGPDECKINK